LCGKQGCWRTLTFLAALRRYRIVAPCVIDGPINGLSFLACDVKLMTEKQVLGFELTSRLEHVGDEHHKQVRDHKHLA
jgi:hypothetical protein